MKINMKIDVSVNNTHFKNVYPHTYGFKQGALMVIKENDVQSSYVLTDLHFGTHLDSPSHWIEGGKNVCDLDLDLFTGKCYVLTIENVDTLSKEVLMEILPKEKIDRIFFRCNSHIELNSEFNPVFVGLVDSGAQYLVDNNIDVIGIDYLSIESYRSNGDAHKTLLRNDVLIYECLDLKNVEDGFYNYIGYPILMDAEASPVRMIIEKL